MTLIEQLVTLVLISVGLLGIAALQVSGLKASQDANTRLRASMLATDILERIRTNPSSFRNNEYEAGFNELGVEGTAARLDLSRWQAEIDRSLPGGPIDAAGSVERASGTNAVTVTIRWKGASNAQTMAAVTHTEL